MGSEWTYVSIGEITTYQKGFAFKSKDYKTQGCPVVRVSDFTSDSVDSSGLYFVDNIVAEKNKPVQLFEDDVVIATVGSWPTNPASVVGKTIRIPKDTSGGLLNQNAVRLRVREHEKHEQLFLFYLLKNKDFADYIVSTAQGSANQASITLKDIFAYNAYLPPKKERIKIARCLDAIDSKINLNHQINQTLESMAQALFKSWFVDFDPVIDNALAAGNPIPDSLAKRAETRKALKARGEAPKLPEEIRSLFPDAFQLDGEMGWIPEGWEVTPVSKALHVNPKVKLPKGTEAQYVDMKAIPTTGYSISEVIEKPYGGGAKFQQHDVLLARITPCLENGKTGLVDFMEKTQVGFGSTEFIVLREQGNLSFPYIACLARDDRFREHCIQNMVGSSGRQRVQVDCLESFMLALPPHEEVLLQFHKMTAPSFSKLKLNTQENIALSTLRDTLLPKLISGELKIPEAEEMVAEAN